MLKALFLALNVRPDEEKKVLLLLGQGFFMGIFLATFQISAETMFLNRLEEYLKEAILISGLFGIIATSLFSFLQNRIPFGILVLGNFVLISLITLGIYFSLVSGNPDFQDYLVFLMFALIGPVLAVSLLSFWGTFGRMFDMRQSKRIIGGIDIGQLTAAIIASLSIPFLGELIPNTADYLLICIVSMGISFVFMLLIHLNYNLSEAELSTSSESAESTGLLALVKNKYVRLLSVFLIFSMVAFTFIQFSFQEVVSRQYPEENQLRSFLAFFNGSILVLSLLLQTFVNNKIIGEYGLKVALIILPVIMTFFTLCSIVAGSGEIWGYEVRFVYFFLFIAVSRLFNYSLRDSLENPTFKLYFMPIDNRIRFNIQTKVEGVVNETARFFAGGLILLLAYFSFELIHYSYALLLVIVGYFYMINRMYSGYRISIKEKLERQQKATSSTDLSDSKRLSNLLFESFDDSGANKIIFSYKLMEKIAPQSLPKSINSMMTSEYQEIRDFAQFKMNELKGLSSSESYIIGSKGVGQSGSDKTDRKVVNPNELIKILQTGDISKTRILKLSKSSKEQDRQYAAELMSNAVDNENVSILVELLQDLNPRVRNTAIKTAQKKNNPEVINALIDNLSKPNYSVPAANALVIIGEKALNILDSAFYKSGQNTQTMLKIVHIMGRIGGEKAIEQLWSKIDYPDKVIVSQVLLALGSCGFKANISQVPRIKYAIESDIEDIAWNMAAINEIDEEGFGAEIKNALHEEIDFDVDHFYMLLGMLYDNKSIQLVKENIDSQTSEGIIYGLELLDVFLSDDLKQRIIPVLDDLPVSEKSKKLEIFYPREPIDSKLVLKFLINRDFAQTNRWTKACIIYQIGKLKIKEFYFDLVSNLFNPDWLIREMSAWSLHEIDPDSYHENVRRLGRQVKRRLDEVIVHNSNDAAQKSLGFDKIMFLRSIDILSGIPGLSTADLVDIVEELIIPNGKSVVLDEVNTNYFYVVYKGSVNIFELGQISEIKNPGEFIGELIKSKDTTSHNRIISVQDSVLLRFKKDHFYELLSDNVKLALKIVEHV